MYYNFGEPLYISQQYNTVYFVKELQGCLDESIPFNRSQIIQKPEFIAETYLVASSTQAAAWQTKVEDGIGSLQMAKIMHMVRH